jgi:hypothetical protein
MSYSNSVSLIVIAVFCLCVAHPGFVFNRMPKIYETVSVREGSGMEILPLQKPYGP